MSEHHCVLNSSNTRTLEFRCMSGNSGTIYTIYYYIEKKIWSCECQGFLSRNKCSHIEQAKISLENYPTIKKRLEDGK